MRKAETGTGTVEWGAVMEAVRGGEDARVQVLLGRFLDQCAEEGGSPPLEDGDRAAIRRLVHHHCTPLRQQAIRAVGVFRDVEAVPELAEVFAAGLDFFDHDFIFEALRDMGDAAVPLLERVLEEGDEDRQCCAAQGLACTGPAGHPGLIRALERGCLQALAGLVNVRNAAALPALIALLEDQRTPGKSLESVALALVASCDSASPWAAQRLIALAPQERMVPIRSSILQALAKLESPDAVPFLEDAALGAMGDAARDQAIDALGDMQAPAAVAILGRLVQGDGDQEIRLSAAGTLVTHSLASPDLKQFAACLLLEAFKRTHDPALLSPLARSAEVASLLASWARSAVPVERAALACVLGSSRYNAHGRLGPPGRHGRFALHHGSARIRRLLAARPWCLEGLTADEFLDLAKDSDWQVRRALATGMDLITWNVKGVKPLPVLEILLGDGVSVVRLAAARNLSHASRNVAPLIERLASDPHPAVRAAGASALGTLEDTLSRQRFCSIAERFLYEPDGSPANPFLYIRALAAQPREPAVYMLSDLLATFRIPQASRILRDWEARGGRTMSPCRLPPWVGKALRGWRKHRGD